MEVSKCIAKCQKIAVQASISLKAEFDIEIRGWLVVIEYSLLISHTPIELALYKIDIDQS